MRGLPLCFPSPPTQRKAERRQTREEPPHRPGAAPPRPDGLGGAARLSASHRGSRQGDLRHPRRNSGHVSCDAVWPVLPTFACPSPASTSRAGRNAGRHDTQAARERAVSSRPQAPHSLSTSANTFAKGVHSERADARYISLGRLSHQVSVTRTAGWPSDVWRFVSRRRPLYPQQPRCSRGASSAALAQNRTLRLQQIGESQRNNSASITDCP